jgi:hypothetical protein
VLAATQPTFETTDQHIEDAFAVDQRARPQIPVVEVEEIEAEEREAIRAPASR